jgi:hypothetical protein
VGHFVRLHATRQLAVVRLRLVEIRAWTRSGCNGLSPIVTSTTQACSFPAKDDAREHGPSVKPRGECAGRRPATGIGQKNQGSRVKMHVFSANTVM